jgi:hypothetical protein
MGRLREEDLFPLETVVRVIKTGQFAIIKDYVYQSTSKNDFQYYTGIIEGRGDGQYVLFPDEIELEVLPDKKSPG